ncbi:MAG: ABC transporter permease [Aliidongia sp.]
MASRGAQHEYVPLIWAGLWRKKTRTIFTLLSILVAFLLFGLLQGVNAAFNSGVEGANLNRLYVQSKISFTENLPYADLPQIEAVPGVTKVSYATWFGPYYQDPKNFIFTFPVDPERYFAVYPELKLPKDQLQAFVQNRSSAVISQDAANKYGWKIGDRVPLHSTIWTRKADGTSDWTFDIVGIFDATEAKGFHAISVQLSVFRRRPRLQPRYGRLVYRADRRSGPFGQHRRRDRQAVPELDRRNADAEREGKRAILPQAAGRHQSDRHADHRRGVLHPAVPDRQHHDAVGE